MTFDARPVALVTGVVSDHRVPPFRELAEREGIHVLAWDDPGPPSSGLPLRPTSQRGVAKLIASGRYRAVVAGIGGRVALPAAYLAARRARIPFVLWASLWAHPRSPAHALSWLPLRAIYANADAVVTYGPHVTRYVEQYRTRGHVHEAPQAVDPELFGRRVPDEEIAALRGDSPFTALFAGRLVPEKGLRVLAEAWRQATLPDRARLLAVGAGHEPLPGATLTGPVPRDELAAYYAAADVLVLPSLPTATFREPWGLVTNEAMHQGTPVIVSDAVGAAAGGLVRDGRNGFVVPAGDSDALAARLQALASNPGLRDRLGAAARRDVAPFTPRAWAEGVSRALGSVGVSRC
jgi:glycosyltransferase involved in cell wall biosynthesis